jgi:hypothetical protein
MRIVKSRIFLLTAFLLLGSVYAEAQRTGFAIGVAPTPFIPGGSIAPSAAIGLAPGFQPGFVSGFHAGVSPGFQFGLSQGFQIGLAPGFAPGVPVVNPPLVIPGFHQPAVVPFHAHPAVVPFHAPVIVHTGSLSTRFVHRQMHFTGIPHVHVVPHNFGTHVVSPGFVAVPPIGHFITPAPTAAPMPPAVGTSREAVLKQLGHPVATVLMREGEILHFNGGLKVFIQNGQVASPR